MPTVTETHGIAGLEAELQQPESGQGSAKNIPWTRDTVGRGRPLIVRINVKHWGVKH